jgi:hypothetical protein
MKEWGVAPDNEQPNALWLEAGLTALMVLGSYIFVGCFLMSTC